MQASFVTPPVPEAPRPVGALVGDAMRRPGGRRAVSVLSVVLFVAGLAMFSYPLGTDLYARYRQGQLNSQFSDPKFAEAYRNHTIPIGEGLTRLKIPKIGLSILVVQGTTPAALRAGAGHYVNTPLPGEVGNVGIAGHRTTFERPFNRLDELAPGDIAQLETPFALYTYRAVGAFANHGNPWVVSPTDYGVVEQPAKVHWLTLTTCHPKGSARQRLVMRFTLVATKDLTSKSGG